MATDESSLTSSMKTISLPINGVTLKSPPSGLAGGLARKLPEQERMKRIAEQTLADALPADDHGWATCCLIAAGRGSSRR